MQGPVRHQPHPSVVVAKDGAEISTPLGQAVGPPLAHADAVAIALAAHKKTAWPAQA